MPGVVSVTVAVPPGWITPLAYPVVRSVDADAVVDSTGFVGKPVVLSTFNVFGAVDERFFIVSVVPTGNAITCEYVLCVYPPITPNCVFTVPIALLGILKPIVFEPTPLGAVGPVPTPGAVYPPPLPYPPHAARVDAKAKVNSAGTIFLAGVFMGLQSTA